jgi:hypothetical protein
MDFKRSACDGPVRCRFQLFSRTRARVCGHVSVTVLKKILTRELHLPELIADIIVEEAHWKPIERRQNLLHDKCTRRLLDCLRWQYIETVDIFTGDFTVVWSLRQHDTTDGQRMVEMIERRHRRYVDELPDGNHDEHIHCAIKYVIQRTQCLKTSFPIAPFGAKWISECNTIFG